MSERFNKNGHITSEALIALINNESMDELARLELAEHLSFCDECIDAYTALLCDEQLISPQQPQAQTIIKRVKNKAKIILLHRYTRAGVAACLAITLWASGVFSLSAYDANNRMLATTAQTLSQRIDSLKNDLSDSITDFLESNGIKHPENRLKGVLFNEKK